ncbi:AMP binding protein [Rhodotorula diobovata]|uniref:AMP binding protein n=1 Tax=Rhodotorula diobovata TaxID=5288 RepID=A0A5C5FVD1_9BASI|nr:AMP binding protein [Rhodotorula diobovata]
MIYESPHPPVDLPLCSVWDKVWQNPTGASDSKDAVIDGPTGRKLSRGELRSYAQRFAQGLRTTASLSQGDVVCLVSPNSLYYHLIVLGSQCAGVVFSGANASYTPTELAHQLADSSAKLVLAHPQVLDTVLAATKSLGWSTSDQQRRIILAVRSDEAGPAAAKHKTLDYLLADKEMEPVKVQDPKNTVAYLGYSSGTSGKAKGVRTSAYNMTSVLSILAPLKTYENDVQLAVLPLNHIYGLTKLVHWPVLFANPVVVMPKFELKPLCSYIERYRGTFLMLVPPIALQLARDPIVDKFDVSSLRMIISGAAPLGPELEQELATRLPKATVLQAYGLTESSPTTHVGMNPKRGSIGPLLPMMRGRIVDPETNKDVKQGESGEMLLAGPNIMLGYLNRPEANAETLVKDAEGTTWLKTGDIARVDEEGLFYITDRLKELIKVKGFQVPPAELEAVLLECPYVADCAVIGIWNDEQQTEYPRAYIVLSARGKAESDPSATIQKWMAGKVAHYKQLKGGIELVDSVPKSPSGKLLRRILREEAKQEIEAAKKAAASQRASL